MYFLKNIFKVDLDLKLYVNDSEGHMHAYLKADRSGMRGPCSRDFDRYYVGQILHSTMQVRDQNFYEFCEAQCT